MIDTRRLSMDDTDNIVKTVGTVINSKVDGFRHSKDVLIHGVIENYDTFTAYDEISYKIADKCIAVDNVVRLTEFPVTGRADDWYKLVGGEITEIHGKNIKNRSFMDYDATFSMHYFGTCIDGKNIIVKGRNEYSVDNDKITIGLFMPVHVKLICDTDVIVGFPDNKTADSYVRFVTRFMRTDQEFIVGVNSSMTSRLMKKYGLEPIKHIDTGIVSIDILGKLNREGYVYVYKPR